MLRTSARRVLMLFTLVLAASPVIGQLGHPPLSDRVRQKAEKGDADAQYRVGFAYEFGWGLPQDYTEAARWYRRAADQGDAVAQYGLAELYGNGLGVPHDYTEAVRWLRRAGDQAFLPAQYRIASASEFGWGVPQDYVEAARWYRKAAEQGDSEAQYDLVRLYFIGQGVGQDYVQAYMWLTLASAGIKAGDHKYLDMRELIATKMTQEQLIESARRAQARKRQSEK